MLYIEFKCGYKKTKHTRANEKPIHNNGFGPDILMGSGRRDTVNSKCVFMQINFFECGLIMIEWSFSDVTGVFC